MLYDTLDKIEKSGFTVVGTLDEANRWLLYTVGLHHRGLPELVLRGLPPDTGNPILQHLGHAACEHGDELAAGARLDLLPGWTFRLVPSTVRGADFVLGVVVALYGEEVAVMQVVWPDAAGAYPWDAGYAGPKSQPVMERPEIGA